MGAETACSTAVSGGLLTRKGSQELGPSLQPGGLDWLALLEQPTGMYGTCRSCEPGRFVMTQPARRPLAAWMVGAMAVGALLVAPARTAAATAPSGHQRMLVPAPHRIDPGELEGLLDQIVAAGAPGAAALVRDEHGVQRAASGLADLRTRRPMRPG